MGAHVFKVVTLIKRHPGLQVQEFQTRLATQYGPLLAASSRLRRYIQSLALPQGYRKSELLFDAITEMWFDSPPCYQDFLATTEYASAKDVESALLDQSRTVVMPVDVVRIKNGDIPQAAVKNIEFVNRRPGMRLNAFRAYWRDVHGPLAARIPVIHRYEQNHLILKVYDECPSPPYDGLAITWFASTADMKRGTASPEYVATRTDEPHFLRDGHLPIIITREHVLKDQSQDQA
jgi:uncharacterized protein (TIGR02118 family)